MIIRGSWSVSPIAVSIESKEKIRSSKTIWKRTNNAEVFTLILMVWSSPSIFWCISEVLLTIRKIPPAIKTRSLTEMPRVKIVTIGLVSLIKKLMVSNSRLLNSMANKRPTLRIVRCWRNGSLLVINDIKIILSIPNTISRNVKVKSAIQFSGRKNISSQYLLWDNDCVYVKVDSISIIRMYHPFSAKVFQSVA